MSRDIALTVSYDGGLGLIDLHGHLMTVYELSLTTGALFVDFEKGFVLTCGDNRMDASCWQIPTPPSLEHEDEDISPVLNLKGRDMDNIVLLCADFVDGVVLGGGYSLHRDGAFVINVWKAGDHLASPAGQQYLQVCHHFVIEGSVVHVEACLQAGLAISGTERGELVVWRLRDGMQMLNMYHELGWDEEPSNFAADFDSHKVVSVALRSVRLWDLLTGAMLATVKAPHDASFLSKSICADLVAGVVVLGTHCSGLLVVDLVKKDYSVLVDSKNRTFGAIAARLPSKPAARSIQSLNTL